MDSITCDDFMKVAKAALWVGKVLAGQRLEKAKNQLTSSWWILDPPSGSKNPVDPR